MSRVDSIGSFKIQSRESLKRNFLPLSFSSMLKQKSDSVHFGNTDNGMTNSAENGAAVAENKDALPLKDEIKVNGNCYYETEKLAKQFVENVGNPAKIQEILNDVDKHKEIPKIIKDFVTYTVIDPRNKTNKCSLLKYALDRKDSLGQDEGSSAEQLFNFIKKSAIAQESFLNSSFDFAEKGYEFNKSGTKDLVLDILIFIADKKPEKFITLKLSDSIKSRSKFVNIANIIADKKGSFDEDVNIDKEIRKKYIEDNKEYIDSAKDIIKRINNEEFNAILKQELLKKELEEGVGTETTEEDKTQELFAKQLDAEINRLEGIQPEPDGEMSTGYGLRRKPIVDKKFRKHL